MQLLSAVGVSGKCHLARSMKRNRTEPMGSKKKKKKVKCYMAFWTSVESKMPAGGKSKRREACRENSTILLYPLCTAARHPVLLRIRIVNTEKKKKKHAMPKQTL